MATHVNPQLVRYVDGLLEAELFKNRGEVANAIGMTDSGFSRAVNDEGKLSIGGCLKLAVKLGDDPRRILRVAGRSDIARILDRIYHEGKSLRLTGREREMILSWRKMDVSPQAAVESIIHSFSGRTGLIVQRATSAGTSPSSGRSRKRVNRKRRFGG